MSSAQNTTNQKQQHYYENYDRKDVVLKTWMNRVREQASILVTQTIEDFRGMTVAGAKGVIKRAGEQFIGQLAVSLFFLLCFVLAKSCN